MRHLLAAAALSLVPTSAAAVVPPELGWHTLSNTTIQSVCAAENGFEQVWGVEGCFAILSWSGGAYDSMRDRLIVTGGGHNGYYGNELYALDPEAGTMVRLTDPGLPPAPTSNCEEAVAGGSQPNSRHTYDGLEYIEHEDRLFVFSGSLACGVGEFGTATWTFDFASSTWERMDPTSGPDYPSAGPGVTTAYHPGRELVLVHDLTSLYGYDLTANRYTRLSGDDFWITGGYHTVAALDPERELYVIVGYSSLHEGGRVYAYDVSEGSDYVVQELQTQGGDAVIADTYPGVDYDPVSKRIVAWVGGDSVYALDPDTLQWTEHTFPGGPATVSQSGSGTHGRWRYSQTHGYFVLVNEYDQDAFAFRLNPDAGAGEDDGGSGDSADGGTDSGPATTTGSTATSEGGNDAAPSDGAETSGGGTESGVSAGAGADEPDEGCGCRAARRPSWAWLLVLLLGVPRRGHAKRLPP